MVGAAVGETVGEVVGLEVGAVVKPTAGHPFDSTHDAQLPLVSMYVEQHTDCASGQTLQVATAHERGLVVGEAVGLEEGDAVVGGAVGAVVGVSVGAVVGATLGGTEAQPFACTHVAQRPGTAATYWLQHSARASGHTLQMFGVHVSVASVTWY